MRIFMTGATTLQTNKQIREPIQKLNVPRSIVAIMEDFGKHEVVWSDFPVGQDFPPGTELVWVNIAPPTSINSRYAMSATWAIAKAVQENRPLVVFFDDWQFKNVFGGYKTMARIGERQFTKTLSGKYLYFGDVSAMIEHKDELMAAADLFCSVNSDLKLDDVATCAIPKFTNWGDAEIVSSQMPGTPRLLGIDPTPFSRDDMRPITEDVVGKKERWLLSSLMPHDKWVEKKYLSWEVDYVGSRKLKAPRLKTERAVRDLYQQYWGILSPEYPQAGAGWFRTRYLYSASAMSVLYCGPKEGAAMHRSFMATPQEIENASHGQRATLAKDQQDFIFDQIVLSDWVVNQQIELILENAMEQKS